MGAQKKPGGRMGTSWLGVLTLADLLILISQGQRKNVPLFLHAVDVGIGGVAPLEVESVLLKDFVEFF
jgi:hypothetical protein